MALGGDAPRSRALFAAAAAAVALLAAGSLALAARADRPTSVATGATGDGGPDGGGSGPSFWGGRWRLQSISMNRGSLDVPPPGEFPPAVLDLTEPDLVRFTACNTGSTNAVLRDGRLIPEDGWTTTEMGCTGPTGEQLHELDHVIGELVVAEPEVRVTFDELTLTHMATVATFVPETEPEEPTTTLDASTSSTTTAAVTNTSTTADPTTTTQVLRPTTTVPVTTTLAGPLALGVGYSVNVDGVCGAFELAGTWVVVEGDVASWPDPGERHEGGTFTLDSPTTGEFVGDAQRTKVATFRLLGPDEQPPCPPQPRY